MATTIKRRPNAKALRLDLDDALGALYEVVNDGTAASSLNNATAMLRVWSLRFQIANHEADTAADDHEKRQAHRDMDKASRELGEWEKRKSVAQNDLVNDLLLKDRDHKEEQDAIAAAATQLQ